MSTTNGDSVCSICGGKIVAICRCPRMDQVCENGHKFHYSLYHRQWHWGPSDHSVDLASPDCCIEKEIVIREKIPCDHKPEKYVQFSPGVTEGERDLILSEECAHCHQILKQERYTNARLMSISDDPVSPGVQCMSLKVTYANAITPAKSNYECVVCNEPAALCIIRHKESHKDYPLCRDCEEKGFYNKNIFIFIGHRLPDPK